MSSILFRELEYEWILVNILDTGYQNENWSKMLPVRRWVHREPLRFGYCHIIR
jgi:hypothetical protein